jgi:hypothetical protein
MKYRIFGQAVSKIHDCFGLCNVVTALDPPFERLFYEDFNGGRVDSSHFNGQYLENCRGITGIIPADLRLILLS